MSLSVTGVWEVDTWDQTVWADGVWREGDYTASSVGSGRKKRNHKHNYYTRKEIAASGQVSTSTRAQVYTIESASEEVTVPAAV